MILAYKLFRLAEERVGEFKVGENRDNRLENN